MLCGKKEGSENWETLIPYLDFASSSLACITTFLILFMYFTYYYYDIISTFLDPYVF